MPAAKIQSDPAATPPIRRRVRMFYLLLAVFTLVALAPLCTVAWRLIDRNREALKTSQQEYQLLLASTLSREIDIHIESLRSQIERGAHVLASALARQDGAAPAATHEILDPMVDERLRYVRFTDLRGRIVETQLAAPLSPEIAAAFLAGFQQAAETLAASGDADPDAKSYPEPFLLPGNPRRAALVLNAPVVSSGRFIGVVSGLVDLQTVWDTVVADHHTGHALYAVDRKGILFASTDLAGVDVGRDMSDAEIVRRFRENPGSVTETMPFDWSARRAGAIERYLGSYEVSREGWAVLVQAGERQFYQPVSTMIDSTVKWGLLALMGALLAAMIFARVLANPIKRLADASRAFSRREFATRVSVQSITEVADLAETFNRMAEELQRHIEQLKQAARENRALFWGTARAMTEAIDAKDPYTRGHSGRVNNYSVLIARALGLPDAEIEDVAMSSLLHDVGKIGVDDAILKKPGQLTAEEFEKMKLHTVVGAKIMAKVPKMERIIPGLRSHHERWAGGGYPENLDREKIPPIARIIAVADSFDAMTTDRPYQRAMSFDQALARLNELKGTAFDEHVVEAFNRAYRAGDIKPPAQPAQAGARPAGVAAAPSR